MILVKDNNGKIHQTTDGTNAIIPSLNVAQEVLWTNANPAQSFTHQSVNLSSSKASYDYILFSFYNGTGQEKIGFKLATPTKPPRLDMPASDGAQVQIRQVNYIDDITVRFENGILNGSTDNTSIIPYQIIGLKFLDTLNYSTEEQYTGKHWIDGKKIYQKTFHFTNTKSGQYIQNLPNFGQLISLEGSINSPATSWVPITYSNPGNVGDYTATSFVENITETSIVLNLSMGSGLGTPANIYVTLRYTKTTD